MHGDKKLTDVQLKGLSIFCEQVGHDWLYEKKNKRFVCLRCKQIRSQAKKNIK
jgi:hypothetical protein